MLRFDGLGAHQLLGRAGDHVGLAEQRRGIREKPGAGDALPGGKGDRMMFAESIEPVFRGGLTCKPNTS